ncbi:MAG: nucleotide exchange factor GrpE [Bacteroidales bacterium]|nr:nucleotide exchange factor GrpE [Bacteroidales bacterium]
MMKKKHREQEEREEKTANKPTENKEFSRGSENSDGNANEYSFSDGSTVNASGETGEGDFSADKIVSDLKSAEEKLAEMQDKYMRLSAEFDNYRKRTLREKMDLSKYAAEDLFRKIIPFMDDFDRAVAHMDTTADSTAIKDGIDLIYNKFSDFLKQNGVKEIESMNLGFNVDLHEAIAKVPVQEDDKRGKVVDVVQKGYYLQDKVLRHSKVVVGE